MQHLNDFPKRDRNHRIERLAITAFERFLSDSNDFFIQSQDIHDYGVDYQLEITVNSQATNIRLFVQLKGTEQDLNLDGSVSISINRANLNYLLMHPYSFYVCFHAPTDILKICFAENILRNYEWSGRDWPEQETLTVKFVEDISESRLHEIAELARHHALTTRDIRINLITNPIKNITNAINKLVPKIHIPEDKKMAQEMLNSLYEGNHDEIISANFNEFKAIFGADHPAMIIPYMSEINKGMDRVSYDEKRIIEGIHYLKSRLLEGRVTKGSLYYSIGNGYTALEKDNEAIQEYQHALKHLSDHDKLSAQCYKNMGGSYSVIGEEGKALECYKKAVALDPHLSEANYALGEHYNRIGEYELALECFDAIVFSNNNPHRLDGVTQWRINTLFNLCDYRSAYREINNLLSNSENKEQVWKWCLIQVATFGRVSTVSAKLSLPFWERFLDSYPHHPDASRELLLAKNYIRSNSDRGLFSYEDFKKEFELHIEDIKHEDAAFLWDRLGHWAQDEDEWLDAESCFRKAYDIDGGEYGYCLGVALNHLGRFEESLPLLLEQAEKIQPDDFSWFQVAVSYEFQGLIPKAIEAYEKCLSLNEKNELALFNLGGVHWNNNNLVEARRVWNIAIEHYPDHEIAHKIRSNFPFILY